MKIDIFFYTRFNITPPLTMNHHTTHFPTQRNVIIRLPIRSGGNNETVGQTAEQAISNWSNIESGIASERIDRVLLAPMEGITRYALQNQFTFTQAIGASNTDVDFNGVGPMGPGTISVKTNTNGDKVCPQNIGQTTRQNFMNHFNVTVLENESQTTAIKRHILGEAAPMMNDYLYNLNACDYLIHIHLRKRVVPPRLGSLETTQNYLNIFTGTPISSAALEVRYISWYHRSFFENFHFYPELITFSRTTIETWNESSSVKYNGVPIGEFQIHNNRNCVKFRFHFKNLCDMIIAQQIQLV